MKPKVFISHASEDKARFVIPFATALIGKGIDAWVDQWEMLPGDSLVDKIFEEGLKEATAVVIVVSPASVAKPWVRQELNASVVARISRGTKIIPVVLGECDVPEALRSTVWVNVPDPSNFDEGLSRVVAAVFGHSEKPAIGSPPAYVAAKALPTIGGLTAADSTVLSSLFGEFVRHGGHYVSPHSLVQAMKEHGIDQETLTDSVGVLEHEGYVETLKTLGLGLRASRIMRRGVSVMLGAKERDLILKVGLAILNQNLDKSDAIATGLGIEHAFVEHAIDCLEGAGHLKATKTLAGPIFVHMTGPSLRRALGS